MAVFKCKMCGGTLEVSDNQTTATCEYCGTQQTLPKLDDEKKANLYDRANHFRRNNDYDKAMGIYEQILNEDVSDAEAYWSLVLCRYGIEYVEDPATHKRVPTVNRAQFTSIFDDSDYKAAIEHADLYQKSIYEAEANVINEIQKGILSISEKEEPFDVFICYKETDANGRRTPDSVLANDLYHQLSQEGFKVFFSRITLEDKLGTAYEPYIFAALNSAKVMVVIGTKPEHFNAVWVKNEWSRYLALVKQSSGKKVLIPAYRDMDPYDLPEEFSHLQAQDMSKLGFVQDLIRGIKKIIVKDKQKVEIKEEAKVIQSTNGANVEALLKRGNMALEDSDWTAANRYFDRVLDMDAEYAEAYLGKAFIRFKVSGLEQLEKELSARTRIFEVDKDKKELFVFSGKEGDWKLAEDKEQIAKENIVPGYFEKEEILNYLDYNKFSYYSVTSSWEWYLKLTKEHLGHKDFIRAYNYGDDSFKDKLDQIKKKIIDSYNDKIAASEKEDAMHIQEIIDNYNEFIKEQKILIAEIKQEREEKREKEYQRAILLFDKEDFEYAKKVFEQDGIVDYKDARAYIVECEKGLVYKEACIAMDEEDISTLECAIVRFESISGWKDADEKICDCKNKIEKLKVKAEAERIEYERQAELKRIEDEVNAKRRKKIATIVIAIICTTIICGFIINTVIIPNNKYNVALNSIEDGNLIEAYEALIAMDGYKDSIEKANSIYDEYKLEMLKVANVGDYVCYGRYEQDNDLDNGKEEIEWLVLDKKDDKVLVISKYALDCQPYNVSSSDTSWETCTLRKWLNDNFLNGAFSDEEKSNISIVNLTTVANPNDNTNQGNDTQDNVFLLDVDEANKYFTNDISISRQCEATKYAYAQGALKCDASTYYDTSSDVNEMCWWWLRTCHAVEYDGRHIYMGVDVRPDGDIHKSGLNVTRNNTAVRPAMWISIE